MTEVQKLTPKEWSMMSESAHMAVFSEHRDADMDRINYVLLYLVDDVPHFYVTVRELDKETVYWQYGGALPEAKGMGWCNDCVAAFVKYLSPDYKNLSFLVENTNKLMLKVAINSDFRPIGLRFFKNDILLEFTKEIGG